jgi:hypothetical protein
MSADTKGRLIGLLGVVLLSPIWFLVAHFTNETRGFVVVCVVGVFATIIYVLRKSTLGARLLLPMAVLFAVELSTALLAPLPSKIPGFIMVPISIGDCVLLIWILSLFDRTLGGHDDDPDAEGPRYSA